MLFNPVLLKLGSGLVERMWVMAWPRVPCEEPALEQLYARGPVRGGILKSVDKKIEFEGTNVEI